ncbi:MAG: hypothetical protein ACP6IY_15980 [Promethearchaeia archaeon]
MTVTIQIKQKTFERLKRLKERKKFLNYDDLINELIDHFINIPKSIFGIDKGRLTYFKDEDRLEFRKF